MITSLSGQVAIVTGGASGIGKACAEVLSEVGAVVVIADRSLEAARRVSRDIASESLPLEVEVTDPSSCVQMVTETIRKYGHLDIAVNNAGIGNPTHSRIADLPLETWHNIIQVNLHGVFNSLRAEIQAMTDSGGSIINISSVMGTVATPGASAYITSKHGVVGLTKATALDYADKKIRVNAVAPGYVDTPMLANRTDEQRAEIGARHPLGRIASPREIANVVAFLASPAASFVTGGYYTADGGYTAL